MIGDMSNIPNLQWYCNDCLQFIVDGLHVSILRMVKEALSVACKSNIDSIVQHVTSNVAFNCQTQSQSQAPSTQTQIQTESNENENPPEIQPEITNETEIKLNENAVTSEQMDVQSISTKRARSPSPTINSYRQ